MTDLALNEDFDVHLDDRNDLNTVDGQAEFEQTVAVKLTQYMYNIAGDTNFNKLSEKIRLQISRVARSYDMLDGIDRIAIERDTNNPGIVNVSIIYSANTPFDFTLNL